jgi:Uma2 family endonuclease
MTVADQTKRVTTEELMAMPEDGVDRWLISGELRESRDDQSAPRAEMTKRNLDHSSVEANFAHLLCAWRDSQPEPHGKVLVGEAGIRFQRNPDTTVGVDVAYVAPDVAAASPKDFPYLDGVPVLIVEILSPSDKHDEISEKIEAYLHAGVTIVCVADPIFKIVIVHRPNSEPQLFNVTQTLKVGPEMPGLHISLRDVFGK